MSGQTSYSAVELMAAEFPEPRFAVPGIIAEGLNLLVGAPKLGKSWLTLNAALAVASGGRAFGQVPVEPGEVLYLALEDGPRRLKRRLEMILRDEPPPDGLQFETRWPPFDTGGLDDLRAWLTMHPQCRCVVVDVIARLRSPLRDKVDRYMADYMMAEQMKTVADEHAVAIVGVHHTRKASSDDFIETVSGTNGLAGAADTVVVLKRSRGQADAALHITGRDVEERELALSFSAEVGTWSLLGDAREWAMSETRRLILECLRDSGPLSPKQVAEETDLEYENTKKSMRRMLADDQLTTDGSGKYAVPLQSMSLQSLVSPVPEPERDSLVSPVPEPESERDSRDRRDRVLPPPPMTENASGPEPWTFPGDLAPCIVCHEPCRSLDPQGRRRHLTCELAS